MLIIALMALASSAAAAERTVLGELFTADG